MRGIYVADGHVVETTDVGVVADLHRQGLIVWVVLEANDPSSQQVIEEVFELHPLTIEDIWHEQVSPKIEDFDRYLYVRVHGARGVDESGDLQFAELDLVFGQNFVLTHDSQQAACSTETVLQGFMRQPRQFLRGPAWLAHSLLDNVVDRYLPLIDTLEREIDELEAVIIERAGTPQGPPVLARIFVMKRSLQALRRIGSHQREILLRLSRAEFDEIPHEALPFYRDVYDHFTRVVDYAESCRDLVTSSLELYMSVQANRMNEIMKALTLISTVMLPLTFIAGIYGMNFEHMPELKWTYGYPAALAMMAVVAIGIFGWFRHRKWL